MHVYGPAPRRVDRTRVDMAAKAVQPRKACTETVDCVESGILFKHWEDLRLMCWHCV